MIKHYDFWEQQPEVGSEQITTLLAIRVHLWALRRSCEKTFW